MPSSAESRGPAGRALRQAALLLALALPPALLTGWLHPRAPDWAVERPPTLSPAAARALTPPPRWVDARPPEAFATGHIPGAIRLGEDDWDTGIIALLEVWEPGERLIVYCDALACQSSREVATRLRRELGLAREEVSVLRGGWEAWEKGEGLKD